MTTLSEGDRLAAAVALEVDVAGGAARARVEVCFEAGEARMVAPEEAQQRGGEVAFGIEALRRFGQRYAWQAKVLDLATRCRSRRWTRADRSGPASCLAGGPAEPTHPRPAAVPGPERSSRPAKHRLPGAAVDVDVEDFDRGGEREAVAVEDGAAGCADLTLVEVLRVSLFAVALVAQELNVDEPAHEPAVSPTRRTRRERGRAR